MSDHDDVATLLAALHHVHMDFFTSRQVASKTRKPRPSASLRIAFETPCALNTNGALRARMLPMLREAPFTPAYKDGRPVNSIRRVEIKLGIVLEDPTLGYKSPIAPGFRPRMDERGNILKVQPYQ